MGWADLTAPDVGDVLAELGESPYLVGIRHHVHDEPDPDWLGRPDVRRGLRAVEAAGLAYDVLLRPRELPAGLAVARDFPGLRLVVDHLAKPPVASGELEPWASLMARVRLVRGRPADARLDWPVCLLAASYDEVGSGYDLARFGAGAARFYRIPAPADG